MDIQLHCTKTGSGPALLLLHGNGEDGSYFAHQVEEFSRDFTVYAVDTRGHGRSPRGTAPFTLSRFADDLAAFMDEQGLETADILGFSDGGNIALLFALRYPNRVRRLIANAANLFPEGMEGWVLEELTQEHRRLAHADTPELLHQKQLLELMLRQPHIDPAELGTLTIPVLVIAGDRDMIRADHTRLIADSIPNARLVILPGDHFLAAAAPAAFNAAVRTFFTETADAVFTEGSV
ncbi:MAG: alpha/beta hydrolase [Ruminococcaceae bacterium]|nr:alpha/beta hydrolase [Oscillospiraceae bacterium]